MPSRMNKRARAALKALKRQPTDTLSRDALPRQAKSAARRKST
jgi:hypothetical protein